MFDSDIPEHCVLLVQHTMSKTVHTQYYIFSISFGITQNNDGLYSKLIFTEYACDGVNITTHDFCIDKKLNATTIYKGVIEQVVKLLRDNNFDDCDEQHERIIPKDAVELYHKMNSLVHDYITDYTNENWKLEVPIFGN